MVIHHRVITLASLYSWCNLSSFCQFLMIACVPGGILPFCQLFDWSLRNMIRWFSWLRTIQWLPHANPNSSPWPMRPCLMWSLPLIYLLTWGFPSFFPPVSSYTGLFPFPVANLFFHSYFLFLQDFAYKVILFCVSLPKSSWRGLPRSPNLKSPPITCFIIFFYSPQNSYGCLKFSFSKCVCLYIYFPHIWYIWYII